MLDDRSARRTAVLGGPSAWAAQLIGRTIAIRRRIFGRQWRGRFEWLWPAITLRLAVRRRSLVPSRPARSSTRIVQLQSPSVHSHLNRTYTLVNNFSSDRLPAAAQPAALLKESDRWEPTSAATRPAGTLAVGHHLDKVLISRSLEVHRLRLSEHVRTEAPRPTSSQGGLATTRAAAVSAERPTIVLRATPQVTPQASERVDARRSFDSYGPVDATEPTRRAAANSEVDVERLTDQVLWRIERRALAQRERLGKA
jgi:hypothetical protein